MYVVFWIFSRDLLSLKGNVEYKLRLLNPTAERFTRLVTQLKWRLLEGGGQAYYELGVADSGQLVGLSRTHLEQTLQTLEEMAGEIGASVIIVKEIEVPAAMREKTVTQGRIADGAMRMHKKRFHDYLDPHSVEDSASGGTTDCDEAELSTPEAEDEIDGLELAEAGSQSYLRTHPERISTQSSPCLEAVEEHYDSASGDESWVYTGELEIATVYKPRPQRRRTPVLASSSSRKFMNIPSSASAPLDVPSRSIAAGDERSIGRERWNRHKRNGRKARSKFPKVDMKVENMDLGACDGGSPVQLDDNSAAMADLAEAAALLSLDNGLATVPSATPALYEPIVSNNTSTPVDIFKNVRPNSDPAERRFIVEALVVRKMSLEEAFLDFGSI